MSIVWRNWYVRFTLPIYWTGISIRFLPSLDRSQALWTRVGRGIGDVCHLVVGELYLSRKQTNYSLDFTGGSNCELKLFIFFLVGGLIRLLQVMSVGETSFRIPFVDSFFDCRWTVVVDVVVVYLHLAIFNTTCLGLSIWGECRLDPKSWCGIWYVFFLHWCVCRITIEGEKEGKSWNKSIPVSRDNVPPFPRTWPHEDFRPHFVISASGG